MPAVARIEDFAVRSTVASILKRAGNLKVVAQAANVSPETAKNWIEGRNAPALATAINLARQIPELRGHLIQLMSPEAEFDPEFMSDFIRMARTYQRLLSAKEQK